MIIILLYITSFLIINNYSFKQGRWRIKFQIIWCFIFLFVFFGFRGLTVLNDTHHYFNAQLSLISETDALSEPFYQYKPDSKWGAGFQILQRAVLKIVPEPFALITVTAFIFTVGTLWLLTKYTNRIALSIFFLLGMSILFAQYAAIRQSIAIVIIYFALYFAQKNKHFYGLSLIWVASLFHSSAYVLYPIYLLTFVHVNSKNIKSVLVLGFFVIMILTPIMSLINMGDNHYVTDMNDRSTVVWSALLISMMIGTILYSCYYLHKTYKLEMPPTIVVWGSIMGLFFNVASMVIIAFDRLALYVVIFDVILFLHYLDRAPVMVRKRFLMMSYIVLYGRITLELILKNEWKHLVPYSFYDFGKYVEYVNFGY